MCTGAEQVGRGGGIIATCINVNGVMIVQADLQIIIQIYQHFMAAHNILFQISH